MVTTIINSPSDFTEMVKLEALKRQKSKCGSCGTKIEKLGRQAAGDHKYGEAAHAHHIRHKKFGGRGNVENCVILCSSCHYSVHEGGNYAKGVMMGEPKDFEFYR
jgi:5-methylcytosine-specific restriction endonuclease McrA